MAVHEILLRGYIDFSRCDVSARRRPRKFNEDHVFTIRVVVVADDKRRMFGLIAINIRDLFRVEPSKRGFQRVVKKSGSNDNFAESRFVSTQENFAALHRTEL